MNSNQIQRIVNEVEGKINQAPRINLLSGKPMTEDTPKATKKDITVVVRYWVNAEDFSKVQQTKLYKSQSGKYCRLLEVLNRMNLSRKEQSKDICVS